MKYTQITFQKQIKCCLQKTAVITGIITLLVANNSLFAAQTTGGVNWIDPLSYQKPFFIPITVPDESSVANKYYIDMSSGSGSTCSQVSPCKNIDDLLGKPGTTGGPAYVYVRGTGNLSLYNDTFYGSAGKEIVIKPWGSATAVFTGNSNANSSNVRHLIFDGGPDLAMHFRSDKAGNYNFHVIAHNITIYRTQSYCTANSGELLFSVGDNSVSSNISFINNEFYGCTNTGDQASALYAGPGNGGGYNNLIFRNNIVRQMGGEGVEINPRVTSSGLDISGNAIHDVGKVTCNTGWQCRPGITMSIQSGGGNNGTVISNNLIWDTGSSCIWDRGGGSPRPVIYNNTCYDYGKGSGSGGPNPQGISGYSNGGSATIRNNIIYAPNGTNPFDSSNFTASNNLCGLGKYCGSSSQTWSANTVLSINQNTSNFMRIGSNSEASETGFSILSVTSSYSGSLRPPYDIGAFGGGGSTTVTLLPPSNLR